MSHYMHGGVNGSKSTWGKVPTTVLSVDRKATAVA